MNISLEDVRGIAELAKLELTDDEVALFADQLTSILQYFEHLQEADTSDVEAISSVLPLTNVLRPDVPGPALSPEVAIANAPQAEDNQFRVSAVLDE
ncbi:MAG: Asp-tRNA(Asn)/Glu-tRNA(Gln) amidotransferase subunit GatC [Chloroflexota bacterium]